MTRKITHALGRISEPVISTARSAHATRMVDFGKVSSRSSHRPIARRVRLLAVAEKIGLEIRQAGTMYGSVLFLHNQQSYLLELDAWYAFCCSLPCLEYVPRVQPTCVRFHLCFYTAPASFRPADLPSPSMPSTPRPSSSRTSREPGTPSSMRKLSRTPASPLESGEVGGRSTS